MNGGCEACRILVVPMVGCLYKKRKKGGGMMGDDGGLGWVGGVGVLMLVGQLLFAGI